MAEIPFRQAVGSLLNLSVCTRPDITENYFLVFKETKEPLHGYVDTLSAQ